MYKLLLIIMLAPVSLAQETGVIGGIVQDAATGKPLSMATVSCGSYSGRTTTDGSFELRQIQVANCRLKVDLPGYAPASGAERKIHIDATPQSKSLKLLMMPLAEIEGTVEAAERKAAAGWLVYLIQPRAYWGSRVLNDVQTATTDRDGRYRFQNVLPGTYMIAATHEPVKTNKEATPVNTFFPSSANALGAQTLQVKAGQRLSHIDIELVYARRHNVSGKIYGIPPDLDASRVMRLKLRHAYFKNPKSAGSFEFQLANVAVETKISPDGSFKIFGLPPGAYFLGTALEFGGVQGPMIEVIDRDIDKIAIEYPSVMSLRIKLEIEDGAESDAMPTIRSFSLMNQQNGFQSIPFNFTKDITVESRLVPAGTYSLISSRRPQKYFATKVTLAGQAVNPASMELMGFGNYEMEVRLSAKVASLNGTVESTSGIVSIAPEPLDFLGHAMLVQWAEIESNGMFEYKGLQPGKWRVCAWQLDLHQILYNMPEVKFQEEMAKTCKVVSLEPGDTKAIALQLTRVVP